MQVSTVDAFQGAEREIIVLSCVRTRHFGFIDSERRMNVALTRAKRHLLIVGSLPCLSRNRLWGRVIHHCRGKSFFAGVFETCTSLSLIKPCTIHLTMFIIIYIINIYNI